MALNFTELSEYWIFCGYELLRLRWERSRVMAVTDKDRETLRRMELAMRDAMYKDLSHTKTTEAIDELVEQTNGDKYAGPLIDDRFQVMEGWTEGAWYIVDHTAYDLLLRANGRNSEVVRFATKKDAEDYVSRFTSSDGSGRDATSTVGIGSTGNRVRNNMAKAARKEEAEAPKRGRGRPAANAPADRAPSARGRKSATTSGEIEFPVVAKKGGSKAAEKAPEASGGGRGRKVSSSGTLASRTRELIAAGKLTEAKMREKLAEDFPDKTLPLNLIHHYFADMERRGLNPPPIKGGLSELRKRGSKGE